MADKGEKIIIRRNKKQAYILIPIEDSDLSITPELQAKINQAREDIKTGHGVVLHGREELDAYLESL